MIPQLTPEQLRQLPRWIERWLEIGLSTQPADRAGAEQGVIAAYAAAGLAAPALRVWLRSPLEGALAALNLVDSVRAQLDQVWYQSRAGWLEVEVQVGDLGSSQVWAQLGHVWRLVRDQVLAQVDSGAPGDQRTLGKQIWHILSDVCYGQHDTGWLVLPDFFSARRPVRLYMERVASILQVAQCCGWWWPYRSSVVFTERPIRLQRDAAHRLHAEEGMAIEYPDGWGIYALHGVRVPAALVLTPARDLDAREWIVQQRNAEVRREAVRKIGIERVCQQLGARVLERGTDDAGQPVELLLLDCGDRRMRPYLKLRHPGTGTYHVEGVPPDRVTLESAMAYARGSEKPFIWQR